MQMVQSIMTVISMTNHDQVHERPSHRCDRVHERQADTVISQNHDPNANTTTKLILTKVHINFDTNPINEVRITRS